MNRTGSLIAKLYTVRNRYGKNYSSQKLNLLKQIGQQRLGSKKAISSWHDSLQFLVAYPDDLPVYQLANRLLEELYLHIKSNERIKDGLYNSGITNTQLCAAFSFEIVKWLRKKSPRDIRFSSFEAADGAINSILSVVMPKVESEILQDANTDWRTWLKGSMKKGEDLLDRFIAVFDETDIRPETRDELWGAIGINVEIDLSQHDCLPPSLFTPYYHRSLIKKQFKRQPATKPIRSGLNETEAEQIIRCGRMILVRHLREIDPITFTAAHLVSYYQLPRGLSVALMGMVPERRHPIDSYMGYVVFKNGLPVAYAGSWILFDSSRIGLNVFPAYRGGESQYIFEQVLELHRRVYHLNRFSVDPYQLGKENSDGIHSGAFWVYYRAGFRPILEMQKQLATTEAIKIKTNKNYRSPSSVLNKLAASRLELSYNEKAMKFDATDISRAYARIIKDQFNNNRKLAEERCFPNLVEWLQIKDPFESNLQFILKNWCVVLLSRERELFTSGFKKTLKTLFELKAYGAEEDYIVGLQRAKALRRLLENILNNNKKIKKYTGNAL